MKDFWTGLRNAILGFCYRTLLKPVFFLRDPEEVHDQMTALGERMGAMAFGRALTRAAFGYGDGALRQTVAGLSFANPVGLAAGFDKDGRLTQILPAVGFGFEEIGSVTGRPCAGNSRPRLWRLRQSDSLLVNYGLKNDGAAAIAGRLQGRTSAFPLGISLAKTNSPDTVAEEAGIADYLAAYRTFVAADVGDYFTVNISCPNAYGGEPFVAPERLDKLLAALRSIKDSRPLFLKMPAELSPAGLDGIVEVARRYRVAGFVSTNLAKDRQNPYLRETRLPDFGGMSGRVVRELSDRQIAYLYQKTKGEFIIIGCGGIFTAEDAYRKIRLGASLLQLITGMIYLGPQAVSEINRGLARLLRRDGLKNITAAVGRGL
ncbi:MAG TPA: quinone-dependent dihydroorotate dehydrogenase [Patescibacteria group bacterium]|nr:quinone-dependent dihydroorotate dehydrogenase [Patescibacteria group bacterium]